MGETTRQARHRYLDGVAGERTDVYGRRGRVAARRGPRLAAGGLLLCALGATALLGYDHRRVDLQAAPTALPDGRVALVDSSGFPGPRSLLLVGSSSITTRALPPVLPRATSVGPSRGSGGLRMSSSGWLLVRLGRIGRDTVGGQITRISPTGGLSATVPLLRWREAAVVGITDLGRAVFREGRALFVLGPSGERVPLLRLDQLGVTGNLSNLADIALAPDGRLAVLVGGRSEADGYRLFVRNSGGEAQPVIPVASRDLLTTTNDQHPRFAVPSVTFAGDDVVVAGDAGLTRFHDGRVRSHITIPRDQRRLLHLAPSALVSLPHGRWALGRDPWLILDGSGRVHRPGFGPCPAEVDLRRRCPAVLAGFTVARPSSILPPAVAALTAGVLLGLTIVGRLGLVEGRRIRMAVTVVAAIWVTTWLAASLVWGELHGSGPLLLLAGAMGAILSPAFPERELRTVDAGTVRQRQPWVSARIEGPALVGGARRLEVTPLPSRS